MGYSFTFNFFEEDIDFCPQSGFFFNYNKFLINEFFNATDEEILVIMRTYRKYYGDSSYNYVMKTYYWGWRHGNRTLSNVQEERILSIMPDLLNKKSKETLNTIKEQARYKLGIEEVVGGIKRTVQYFLKNQRNIYSKEKVQSDSDLLNIFQKEIIRAKHIEIVGPFFVLTDDEKNEVLNISKYIVFIKLKKQFDQIEKDFNTFLPFMQLIKRGIFAASYDIQILNLKLDLTETVFHEIKIPQILIEEIIANSRFKAYSDKYLANELVTINSEANKAISTAFLNGHDLKLFFDHYDELSLSESEVSMKSSFIGESGNLNIQIQLKPIKMIKTSIAKSLTKILIYTIILVGLIIIVISNNWYLILIFGGLFGAGFYFSFLSEEIKYIKNLKTEIKQYGQ